MKNTIFIFSLLLNLTINLSAQDLSSDEIKTREDKISAILETNHFQAEGIVHPKETDLASYKIFSRSFEELLSQLQNNETYQLPVADEFISFDYTKEFNEWQTDDALSSISDANGEIYTLSLRDERIKPFVFKSFGQNRELLIWTISADFRYVKGVLYFENGESYIFQPLVHYKKYPEVVLTETTFISYNEKDNRLNESHSCQTIAPEQSDYAENISLLANEQTAQERDNDSYECDLVVAFMTNTNMLTKYGTVAALETFIANMIVQNVPRWDDEFPVHHLNYISSGNYIQMGSNVFTDDTASPALPFSAFNSYLDGVSHILPGGITAMSFAYISDISFSSASGIAGIGFVIPSSPPFHLASLCTPLSQLPSGLCLYDGNSSSTLNKVLTHEIGHQWGKNHVLPSDCGISCYMNSSVSNLTNQWHSTTIDTLELFFTDARLVSQCLSGCSLILPVELNKFVANNNNCEKVELFWETAQEFNSDYFELEKSYDARTWFSVTKIAAGGTTNWEKQYNYTDRENSKGNVYYRLKQYDFDGTEAIFAPVSVDFEDCEQEFDVYPNPTSGELTLRFSDCEEIQIFDYSGKKVNTTSVENLSEASLQVDLSGYGKGVYRVLFLNGDMVREAVSVVVE